MIVHNYEYTYRLSSPSLFFFLRMTNSNSAAINSSSTTIATAAEPAANAMGPNGRLLVAAAEERVIETLGLGLLKTVVAVVAVEAVEVVAVVPVLVVEVVAILTAGVGSGVVGVYYIYNAKLRCREEV